MRIYLLYSIFAKNTTYIKSSYIQFLEQRKTGCLFVEFEKWAQSSFWILTLAIGFYNWCILCP